MATSSLRLNSHTVNESGSPKNSCLAGLNTVLRLFVIKYTWVIVWIAQGYLFNGLKLNTGNV